MSAQSTAAEPQRAAAQAREDLARVFGCFFRNPPNEGLIETIERRKPFGEDVSVAADARDLRIEFDGLFVVPAAQYVYPFESCYRAMRDGRPGALMGPAARQARACYQAAGFDARLGAGECPDHAGVEFGFLELLCRKEGAALVSGALDEARLWRERQVHFLDAHLLAWIPALCRNIEEVASLAYFRRFAEWIPESLSAYPFQEE